MKKCSHGFNYFCPKCKINIQTIRGCPVPLIWTTHPRGKTYIYDEFWRELICIRKNWKKLGVFPKYISKFINLDARTLRHWANEDKKPKIYTKEEFYFTKPNLYFLGLFYSDGHLRNNGSKLSFTFQTSSCNPFQGYWYPQIIQKFLPLYKHKKRKSITYINKSEMGGWAFRANVSSLSPIFVKFIENKGIVAKKKIGSNSSTCIKKLPNGLFEDITQKDILFQGIFDGDGHVGIYNNSSMGIHLALEPTFNHAYFIKQLPLVPTLAQTSNRECLAYYKCKDKELFDIAFVPSSLNKLNNKIYSIKDIIDQFKFMIEAAHNSIRPDKVHQLIKIIERICSKRYGEYRSCLEIQKEIRKEAVKNRLAEKAKELKKRYPIKDDKYKPFMPKWAEEFCSKRVWFQEAWNFFLNGENLNPNNYPNKKALDFSEGVGINFTL